MSRAKRIGTDAEVKVRDYLRANGFPLAERLPSEGWKDRGDISGLPEVTVEVKGGAGITLSAWLQEAEVERQNAKNRWGVVWFKKKGKTDPGAWYVCMDGATFLDLFKATQRDL